MSERELGIIKVHTAEYVTEITERYKNRMVWEKPNLNLLHSFMPGTIIELKAKVGEELKEGDPILIFEAMKMHNLVQMPFDAKIKAIYVKEGEKIAKGHLMIELA